MRKPASRLHPQPIQGIAVAIHYGSSRTDTAAGFGLHYRTLPKWLARGEREPDSVYGALNRQVSEARRHRIRPSPLVKIAESAGNDTPPVGKTSGERRPEPFMDGG